MADLKYAQSLFEQFECPICMDYYHPPIHLCTLGHSICDKCKVRSRNCPQCRQPFVANSRNISLEKMLEQISKKCKFEGCDTETTLDKWHNHVAGCEFNPNLRCIECGSSEESLISHLVRTHDYKEITMEENKGLRSFSGPRSSWINETEWPKGIWKFGEEYFVVKAKTRAKVFHVYLYRVSKVPTAVSLKIENNDNSATITFQGDVPHISEYSDFSTEPHFHCEIKQLMNFIKEEESEIHKLSVTVKKKNIKNE